MNKSIIIFVAAFFLFSLFSCYEDKGDYDYDWKTGARIIPMRDTTVKRGDTLYYTPNVREVVLHGQNTDTLSWAQIDPDNYEYAWIRVRAADGRRDTLSRKFDFGEPVTLSGGEYRVEFFVTSKQTGVADIAFFTLTVTNNYRSGMLFLTEEEGETSELNMFANTVDGREIWERNMLASGDFPYKDGKPLGVMYQQFHLTNAGPKKIWVLTEDGLGWLHYENLRWAEGQDLGTVPGGAPDLKFAGLRFYRIENAASGLYAFYTENGGARMIGNASSLEPDIAFLGSASESNRIRISPMAVSYQGIAGSMHRMTVLVNDETHSQLLGFNAHSMNQNAMDRFCHRLPATGSAIGMEALHLQSVEPNRRMYAVMKDRAGTYWRFAFQGARMVGNSNKYSPGFTDSLELVGTAALGTINHFFLQPKSGIVYCIMADNSMRYYHEASKEWRVVEITDPDGVLETGMPAPANWDPVRIIQTDWIDSGQFPWAGQDVALFVTYSEEHGGNFYALKFNRDNGADVKLTKTIADVGNVKSMSYFIP